MLKVPVTASTVPLIYTAQKITTGHAMCTEHTTDLLNILFGAAKLWQNSVGMHVGNMKFST